MLRDKVIVLDGRDYWSKMRRSLGHKRKLIDDDQIIELTKIYRDAIAVAADIVRMKVAQARHSRRFARSIVVRLPLGFEGSD